MSAIREFLEEKAALPLSNEWLRREPRGTHPDILAAVREAEDSIPPTPGGVIYDDSVEQFVNARAGDLPSHQPHGERDRVLAQLGHEVYIARGLLRDEVNQAAEDEALADGFAKLADVALVPEGRYLVRPGTLYSGYSVPVYGKAREVRAVNAPNGWGFLPKGARTRGFLAVSPMLVKAVTA